MMILQPKWPTKRTGQKDRQADRKFFDYVMSVS